MTHAAVLPAFDFFNESGMETGVEFVGPLYTMDGIAPSYYITDIKNDGVFGLVGHMEGEWKFALLREDGEYVPGDEGYPDVQRAIDALLNAWEKEYSNDSNA